MQDECLLMCCIDSGNGQNQSKQPHPCPMCAAGDAVFLAQRTYQGRTYRLARCRQCGQHFCSPPPTETEIAGFYSGDYHAELRTAGGSERAFGRKFRSYREWIATFVTSGRSLDIGTATGLLPSLLKQVGFDAEGLEHNEASAKWGEAHFRVRIAVGELLGSGLPTNAYDLITMTDVLEHTPEPLRYLQTVRAYLKPRGFMLITFPDIESVESRWLRYLAERLRRDWIWGLCQIPLHVWEFTPQTARAMFIKAGFEIVGFRRSGGGIFFPIGSVSWFFLHLRLLKLPLLERWTGSQIEFMIRRND